MASIHGTYSNGNYPKHPAPAFSICQKPAGHGTDHRTQDRAQRPDGHDAGALLLGNHVGNGAGADGQGTDARDAGQQTEDHQLGHGLGDGAGDGEDEEEDVAGMIERHTAVHLGQRGDDKGAHHVPENVDGDNKGGEHHVGFTEISHDARDSGGEHGGREGSIQSVGVFSPWERRPYVIKVLTAMRTNWRSFFHCGQLKGFSRSFGPSKSTVLSVVV